MSTAFIALSSGGSAARQLCGGFWLNIRPSAGPSEEGHIFNFHNATYGGSLLARESERVRACVGETVNEWGLIEANMMNIHNHT